ncbi:hypothetical protein HJC23_011287 [Cyclotella cryptica]|uniref:Uncharacterized protein n=1 Tax=Cyclotella cryptica TaxID=29204 RepID=A0ABD3QWM9_9STRA
MPKRGIDTPAKDDPNRKKPCTRQEDTDVDANPNANINENPNGVESSSSMSRPAPTLIQSVCTALSSAVAAPDVIASSKQAAGAATRQKHAPSTSSGTSRIWARALGAGNSAKKIPAAVDNKNSHSATPDKKPMDPPKPPEVRKDIPIKCSDTETAEPPTQRSTWGTKLVALLGILNIASLTYIISEQSRHNTAQMRCLVEIEKLNEELARNRGVVSILQSGMDAAENRVKAIEQAQEKKRKEWEEERRTKTVGLSEEERNAWLDRKRVLMEKREQLLEGFHHWLAELDGIDGV